MLAFTGILASSAREGLHLRRNLFGGIFSYCERVWRTLLFWVRRCILFDHNPTCIKGKNSEENLVYLYGHSDARGVACLTAVCSNFRPTTISRVQFEDNKFLSISLLGMCP
jgi:hypothetical protein